ncbi:FHA domain-containing protein [Cryobacterium psychrophilum]|uniref:FHA domain-containing protein n=1 Tax=Cryobacterium psychrophilum TaxID=41988 RepID=A0A4Y8KL85_9MICO|nr:FHA domain-containing protein [Cryobacterium psychrophilum]TDW29146.1 hypothetical protein EDD25_0830 [Cryobacterium psychrophilum]TFD77809.1 FHA domain-containing protein [Cryobacterium psychrophilum]
MTCQICGVILPTGAMFCGECGSSRTATPLTRKRPDPRPNDTTIIAPLPPRSTVVSVPVDTDVAPAKGRPPMRPETVQSGATSVPGYLPVGFVLQFSTGETVSVRGSGLIGRRPMPQPGEAFDVLLPIADVGMSVSKTHLEFGQHEGEFWVNDRFSGNGTVLRRPNEAPVRCEPGRRYRVLRRSRVEMADQHFTVN